MKTQPSSLVSRSVAVACLLGALSASASVFDAQPLRQISPIDDPGAMLGGQALEKNLFQMDNPALRRAQLDRQPWADYSWRLEAGLIGLRYDDGSFRSKGNWKSRRDYIEKNSIRDIVEGRGGMFRNTQAAIDRLSPAEKYDMLVGDYNGGLTHAVWEAGEDEYRQHRMASWLGICEGWSAASVMFPEPTRPIEMRTPDGKFTVRFNALDIKGLASMLWSAYNVKIRIVGSRCEPGFISRDSEGCFNNNPGSWHIAALNLLGMKKAPLFMDRATNGEVWNSPVVSYEMDYVNRASGRTTSSPRDAAVRVGEFRDPYAGRHAAGTAYIVGVEMRVKVAMGHTSDKNGSNLAELQSRNFSYDLELGGDGTIIGGEWRSTEHPDFLWTIAPGLQPNSLGDRQLPQGASFSGDQVPAEWLNAARTASSGTAPLAAVVNRLVQMSAGR